MSISIMSFKQVSRALGITRKRLLELLKKSGLIQTIGHELVYQNKKSGKESFSTERFTGKYIVNNESLSFNKEHGGRIPQQFLDSRVINILHGLSIPKE